MSNKNDSNEPLYWLVLLLFILGIALYVKPFSLPKSSYEASTPSYFGK